MSLLGRSVVINGLVAKPHLNGHTGTALSFDDDKGRYLVELDQSSASLMIKPCNLLPAVCSVALCSLFSRRLVCFKFIATQKLVCSILNRPYDPKSFNAYTTS
jgi:hypothetical protein